MRGGKNRANFLKKNQSISTLVFEIFMFIPVTSTEPPENVGVVFVLRVGGDLSEF